MKGKGGVKENIVRGVWVEEAVYWRGKRVRK